MGVFGELVYGNGNHCFTCERPWLNNEPNISCIPEGQYFLALRKYNRGGYDAVELKDVLGRSYILIHIGNTMDDSAGCILLGSNLGYVNGKWAVTGSRVAFNKFMDWFNQQEEPVSIIIKH